MSEENVGIARSLYPGSVDIAVAFLDAAALIQAYEPLVTPDFEGVFEAGSMPMGDLGIDQAGRQAARGVQEFVTAWREWLSAWESWVATPTQFIDVDDDRVLVLMHIDARSKTHHVELPIEGANLLTLRDGKVARLELFLNETDALKAAGLSE